MKIILDIFLKILSMISLSMEYAAQSVQARSKQKIYSKEKIILLEYFLFDKSLPILSKFELVFQQHIPSINMIYYDREVDRKERKNKQKYKQNKSLHLGILNL